MTDGRKYRPAHRAPRAPIFAPLVTSLPIGLPSPRRLAVPTVAALALGLTGTGVLAAAPAGAADLDTRIDRAQTEVDRLDQVADDRAAARQQARDRVGASEARVERLTARIKQERKEVDDLRTRVARSVLIEHAATSSDAVPVSATTMTDSSEGLLAGVAVVTEDTGGTTEKIAAAEAQREVLAERRADVREVLRDRRSAAQDAGTRAQRAGAELDAAQGRLATLEQEREEQQAEQVASGAVAYAMAQVGKSYVWGAAGPDSFDCSGLTMAAWATEGVSLPHNSQAQYAAGTPVSESELQPGDLVFYYSPISHVGIYVGNGQIVNALNPGSGVQVSGLHDMPFSGAVRPG